MEKKLYTPLQIGLGTFLGGPLGATYFLKSNFDELDDEPNSNKALFIGLTVAAVLMLFSPFLPEHTPNMLITLIYLIPVIMIANKTQKTKQEIENAPDLSFQSSWKVLGIAILCVLSYVAIAFFYIGLLQLTGVINLS